MPTHDELYIAVLRKERLHLLSLFDQTQEGTGHYNTAAGVLETRINQILEERSKWPVEYND
jgi:hypothetical protein